ncbi:MAG TPA: SRPBCC family protein [Devosia sp.]|nr:SRPBCC family protein [Devosia sp.]
MTNALPTHDTDRDLVLTRVLDAPRDKIYRCWTQPDLIKQWFAPKPWSTPKAEIDLRPGGANVVTMADETGTEYPNPGQYLEIVPNQKLVFTDAYVGDWEPSAKPFFTAIITFEDAGESKTRYTAIARHWTREDAESHKKMGFHEGWGMCATQLEELAARL